MLFYDVMEKRHVVPDRPPDRTVVYPPNTTVFKELKLHPALPNPSSLRLLSHRVWANGGPFQCLLDYVGLRYNFLLDLHEGDSDGSSGVSKGLRKLYEGFKRTDYSLLDEGATDCFQFRTHTHICEYLRSRKCID